MTGSAIAVEWAQENAARDRSSPGTRASRAATPWRTCSSARVNPAGRLPVTFYKSVDQLPPFADYDMKGRTYRYFNGEPLYPFGHGLSYTRFEYSDLRVDRPRVRRRGTRSNVSVRREERGRAGRRRGRPALRARPGHEGAVPRTRSSAASSGCRSQPGEQQQVTFRLAPAAATSRATTPAAKAMRRRPGDYELQVGASSRDIRLTSRLSVRP